MLDRRPLCSHRDQGNSELVEMMLDFNLVDIFRHRFQTKQTFTFTRGNSKSRIDFFFTSCLLDRNIDSTLITHFPFSHHYAFRINIEIIRQKRPRGFENEHLNYFLKYFPGKH